MSNIIYLDSEDIRYLHEEALIRYGGIYGEHESGMIDYMADKPEFIIHNSNKSCKEKTFDRDIN